METEALSFPPRSREGQAIREVMRRSEKFILSTAVLFCSVARGKRSPVHPDRGVSWLSKHYGGGRSRRSSSVVAAALPSFTPSQPPPPPPPSSSRQGHPPDSSVGGPSTNEHTPPIGRATPAAAAAALTGRAASPQRFLPQHLSSSVSNITRALLPFVPLIVEAPVLTAHARAAWPWARAALAVAAKAAFVRHPLAFVTPPASLRPREKPQQQQQRRGVERRHRAQDREQEARETSLAAEYHRLEDLSRSSSRCRHGHNNATPAPLTRRGAIHKILNSATRWCAAGAAAGSLARNGVPACATVGESGTGVTAAGSIDGSSSGSDGSRDQFGSKAFTKKSYDGFADGYDDLDGGWAASALGTEELRSQLLARATGRVLEVGVGTGLNLRHYRRDLVSGIDAVDLSPGMLRQAALRSDSLGMKGLVKLAVMDVERLGFPSNSFDTVVDTFSLCVFSDPTAALREMARVCKPGGRVLLLENSKSKFGPMAAYQDLTASYLAEKGGGKGCFWNQDVEALCRGAGLEVVRSSPALVGGLFRTLECVPAET